MRVCECEEGFFTDTCELCAARDLSREIEAESDVYARLMELGVMDWQEATAKMSVTL